MPDGSATVTTPLQPEDLELGDRDRELALPVTTARVVAADYARILDDFPWLAAGAPDPRRTKVFINRWLLHHAAIVSRQQASQTRVNSPIATGGPPRSVFRPPAYRRAFVVPVNGPDGRNTGLLDVKGTGVPDDFEPDADDYHRNGLLLLADALQEQAKGAVLQSIFDHARSAFQALPIYAILDLGFDGDKPRIERVPCAVLVRRAHRRVRGIDLPTAGSPEQRIQMTVELLIRSYGLSSAIHTAHHYQWSPDGVMVEEKLLRDHRRDALEALWRRVSREDAHVFERINVQITADIDVDPLTATLVDFGHYRACERFEMPIVSSVFDRPFKWGGVMWPDDPDFVQVDKRIAIPFEHWSQRTLDPETSSLSAALRKDPDPTRTARQWLEARIAATRARWAIEPTDEPPDRAPRERR